MMPIRSTALFTLLTLVLTSVAWADRGSNGQHNHGERGNRPTQVDNNRLRPAERPRRDAFRYEERHDDYHRDDRRRYGNDRGNEAVYQRLHDGGGGNSGYYRRGAQRPVNDVIREVQDRYGGQVIGVQNSEGGSMYRVRVLQRDGRVKNVMVPAE